MKDLFQFLIAAAIVLFIFIISIPVLVVISGLIGEFNRSEFKGEEPILTTEVLGKWQSRDKSVILDLLPDGTALGYFKDGSNTQFQQGSWNCDYFTLDNLSVKFKRNTETDLERTIRGIFLGPAIFYCSDPDVALDPDISTTFDSINSKSIRLENSYRSKIRYDTNNGGYYFIDRKGNTKIFGPFVEAHSFKEGYSWVSWRYISGTNFCGLFESYIDKKGIHNWNIDESVKKKISVKDYSTELKPFRDGLKWGFRDDRDKIVISPEFEWADWFCEGLAVVRYEGMFGLINNQGKWVVQPKYFAARRCSQGLIPVADSSGMWFYISKDGSIALNKRFYSAHPFSDDVAVVFGPVSNVFTPSSEIKASQLLVVAQSFHHQDKHSILAVKYLNSAIELSKIGLIAKEAKALLPSYIKACSSR